jgi:hypothetical protein
VGVGEEGSTASAVEVVSVRLEIAAQGYAVGRAGVSENAERMDSETEGIEALRYFRTTGSAEAETVVQQVPQLKAADEVSVLDSGANRAEGVDWEAVDPGRKETCLHRERHCKEGSEAAGTLVVVLTVAVGRAAETGRQQGAGA